MKVNSCIAYQPELNTVLEKRKQLVNKRERAFINDEQKKI